MRAASALVPTLVFEMGVTMGRNLLPMAIKHKSFKMFAQQKLSDIEHECVRHDVPDL